MRIKLLQNTFDSVTGTEYKAGTIVDVEQNRAEQCCICQLNSDQFRN